MKMILCNVWDDTENVLPFFVELLDFFKVFSLPLTEEDRKEMPVVDRGIVNTHQFLYFESYKFDRFDKDLIQSVENLNKHNASFFYIENFDERFKNKKYYGIQTNIYTHRNNFFYKEQLYYNDMAIIDDLYYKKYEYVTPFDDHSDDSLPQSDSQDVLE